MKIDDIKRQLEESQKYEEELSRISAKLKKISAQQSGRITAAESAQLLRHLRRLRQLECYHQIEHSAYQGAQKVFSDKSAPWEKRAQAALSIMGLNEPQGRPRADGDNERWILFRYKRLLESGVKSVDALKKIAGDPEFGFPSLDIDSVKKRISRYRKRHPDIFSEE